MSSHKPIRLSPRARQDLIDILRYTGEIWGRSQLFIYRNKIDDALVAIGGNTAIGQVRRDLPSTHKVYLVGTHIIIYRDKADVLGIVRILHQRMSIGRHV